MPIKYYLQPNTVSKDPNDQRAVIAPNSVLTNDDIIQRVVNRGSTFNQADVMGVLQLFYDEATSAVAEGNYLNLPLVNMRPGIQGIFPNAASGFDATRNTLRATYSSGLLMIQKMAAATVQKVSATSVAPDILEFIDTRSASNSQASQSGIGTLIGSQLKFNPLGPGEGIFFINTTDGTETQASEISTRTDGKLVFIIPATLLVGTVCWIEVRRAYTQAGTIRNGRLNQAVTVIA